MWRFVAVLVALVVAVPLFAFDRDPVHDVAMPEARRLLQAMPPATFVFGSGAPRFETRIESVRGDEEARIAWVAMRGGGELFRYVATITDAGRGRTRVALDLTAPAGGGPESAARRLEARPAARALYVAAMREQIAATLDRRDYDMSHVSPALMAASVENSGSIKASADRAAEASRRSEPGAVDRTGAVGSGR